MELINELKKEVLEIEKQKKPCSKKYVFSDTLDTKIKNALIDLDENHNHSWAIEIFKKNVKNFNKTAIQYRGNNISYELMFIKAYEYAKSLKCMGYEKNDEIPVCVTNIPEFIYLFLATSFIGAKINVVADWFNEDYLVEIFNNSRSKNLFVDDLSYENIKNAIENSNVNNIIMFSLTDSLPKDKDGKGFNPYKELEKPFHLIENKLENYRNISKKSIYSENDFAGLGRNFNNSVLAEVDLNDVLTITYTSGTTSPGRPKGVKQSNRTYISLARNYEPDVSTNQEMKDMKFLGHIATDTHISLSCGISDTLYCGCTYDCEPFYSKEFFPYALLINKSNFVTASVGYWGYLCKLLNLNPKWKNVKMPFLMLPTVTGEGCSPGEEKYFNYTSRKHKFGTEKLPFPFAPAAFSIGGGTTEGTGIFVTLFKALQEKLPNNIIKKEGLGLTPLTFAEIEVLNSDLDYCKIGEPGLLVEKSPCEMLGYTDEKLNLGTRIIDKYGKEWLSLGTYSYKSDKSGRIKMKGRMRDNITLSTGEIFPLYLLEDAILKDTKNIMSCSVVNIGEEYVCHIELQPNTQKSYDAIIKSMIGRLKLSAPEEILDKIMLRNRDIVESYPLDPSGKRSLSTLINNGIDEKCESFRELEERYYNKKELYTRKRINK